MPHSYAIAGPSFRFLSRGWALAGLLLLLGGLPAARAQSGPFGNEWLVPGQPYYKVKVWRDGLYRLDYAYLSQLGGAGAVAPSQLQLWRRGREVAVYQGGNAAALDNTSYLEFYGQRNDGALDREYYKNPLEQANPHYSFFTDTAAYFVTWGSRPGKRMAQPAAAGGEPHGWRLQSSLVQKTGSYCEGPTNSFGYFVTFLPWLETGEGFFENFQIGRAADGLDSLLRAVSTAPGAPAPQLEATVVGGYFTAHRTSVGVLPPGGGAARVLGELKYNLFEHASARYPLLPTDLSGAGNVTVAFDVVNQSNGAPFDVYRRSWWRVTAPQQNVWFADRRQLWFRNDSTLGGPATYEVDNVPATVRGYDIHDPWNVQRIEPAPAPTLGAAGRRYVFPAATSQQTRRLLLADAARAQVPPPARRVNFRVLDPARPTFVIITHPQLMGAAGGVPNVARAYANYRASAAGGRFDTLMVTAPQLYEQFHYGERSLMGLRHFARWLAASKSPTRGRYLLLLGKGIAPGSQVVSPGSADYTISIRTSATANSSRGLGEHGLDLVPISTRSPSDNFLSSDWPHDDFTPALTTGRVVATTPQEAVDYLTKLQEYEAQTDPNQPSYEAWHKNVVHLVGGNKPVEFAEFGGYMDKYKRRIERPLLGGQVTTFRVTDPNNNIINLNLAPQLNAGLSVIKYFGHGSTTVFNINLGDIYDPVNGYTNAKRYPVLMFNGCTAGSAFFNGRTFGSDWLLAPGKGSIGMMAETGASFPQLLDAAQDLYDQLLFNDPQWFGRPVAEVHGEVVRRLQTNSLFKGNLAATEQLLCTLWQGDPALRLYAPAKPDLVASSGTLSLSPLGTDPAVTAASTQFTLNIGVSNPLRITRDSVEIRVTRSYPAGSGRSPDVYVFNNHNGIKPFPQAFRRDTTYAVVIPNTGLVFGDNIFKVELDYRNKIAEQDESNNIATLTYSFLKRGLTLLAPTEFAIVPGTRPRLVAQSNDPAGLVRGYDLQVDSVASFDSPALQQSLGQPASTVVSWTPPKALLPAAGRDSAVWYWRVRFSNPVGAEDAAWLVSSLRVIPAATRGGWSQSHNGQFNRDQLRGVTEAAPGRRWRFAEQQQPLLLRTVGGGGPGSGPTFGSTPGLGVLTDPGAPPYVGNCAVGAPNLLLAVLDQNSLRRLVVPGAYATCGPVGQAFYHFASDGDTLDNLNNSAARRAQLLDLLGKLPDGAYVALVSENRLRFASPALAATLQQVANLLGSKLATTLRNGEPWALVAQKRAAGGRALAETGPDRGQPAPASQAISLSYRLGAPGQAGSVTSTLIGPAQRWQTLYNTIRRETPTAGYTLTLSGVDATGKATVLNPNVGPQPLDLSAYSAATYPFMQLQLALVDSVSRTPPQLKQWLVTYQGLPEGVVRRDLVAAAVYDSTRLKAQALTTGLLRFPVKFDNVSAEAFASRLQVQVQLINAATGLAVPGSTQLLPTARDLLAGDSVLTTFVTLSTVGHFGKFYPRVFVNPPPPPLQQPEQYYFNNELKLDAFTLRDTSLPPTLDVAFDSRHILDGELVAPRPLITIQLKDQDRLRLIRDASAFTLYLQRDGQAAAPVDVNGPQVRFTVDNANGSVARLDYQPGLNAPLPNGTYTLRVQGRNAANLSAGTQDFQVKFQVVNESSITNVFPYPNPVTSKARFVFTVTGQELPRNMKIQIMTLTGRVVREIFMSELGPLHIGNNLTDYAWDGTDQYGDRLANGTYLYRVALDDPKADFKHRDTAGDQAFKNDWGKLVLLR